MDREFGPLSRTEVDIVEHNKNVTKNNLTKSQHHISSERHVLKYKDHGVYQAVFQPGMKHCLVNAVVFVF